MYICSNKLNYQGVLSRKEKYASKALEIFKQEGLRHNLEEIAEKIGITKKTLYNNFDSKEDLLRTCITSYMNELRQAMLIMVSDETNAIEGLIRGISELGSVFRTLNHVFLYDLRKLYPEIAGVGHSAGSGFFVENVRLNIIKGKKEKLFRDDIDEDLISTYFSYSMVSFFLNRVLSNTEIKASVYFRTVLDYHLHAIATQSGRELIAAYNSR